MNDFDTAVPRGPMPKLSDISRAWERVGNYGLLKVFPDLRCAHEPRERLHLPGYSPRAAVVREAA